MNRTHYPAILLACLSSAPLFGQDQETAPQPEPVEETHPMEVMARLENGHWRLTANSAWGAYHRYEWGVGRRLLRSTSSLVVDDLDTPFAEGLYYWHPVEQDVRLVGFDTSGALYEGRLEVDGPIWSFHFDHFAEGQRRAMLDRWTWRGEETYYWTAFIKNTLELDPWMNGSFTRQAQGPREATRAVEAWGSPFTSPLELEPLAPLLDGDWEIDATRSDGTAVHVHTTFEWGLGKRSIHSRTWRIAADGTQEAIEDSYYFWHPGRRTLRMLGIGEDGRLCEGALHLEEDTLVLDYAAHTTEGSTEFHERWRFTDDGIVEQRLWTVAGDAERSLVFECSSRRREEPH